MQRYTTIALFSAIALSVGILGVYGLTSISSTLKAQSEPQSIDSVPLLGHVTMVVTDPKGNILEYHQGDNIVVRQAGDCLADKIFGSSAKVNDCPSGGAAYTAIAIGNQSSPSSPVATQTALDAEIGTTTTTNLQRQSATITGTQSTGSAPASVLLQATFTDSVSTSKTITESGIFNSTTTNAVGMFARQTTGSITLNQGDSLTVKWTVTIGT